ncbi:MAG: hypothetical protein JO055_16870 [Alphaproteobacteria bacterium]|nr:hypothetical protein [Alphaproteobacteria bacterium]
MSPPPIDGVVAPVTPAAIAVSPRYVEWGPVIAGAVAAAAISFVLLAFGGAIGLSATSAWPGRGISLPVTFILFAIWMALVQAGAFAAGGYIAGRLRSGWDGPPAEHQFRNGAHGLLVWGLGVLIGAVLAAGTIVGTAKTAIEGASTVAAGAASRPGGPGDVVAMTPADYGVDYLFRPGTGPVPAGAALGPPPRAEALRIMSAALHDNAMTTRDRAYLAQIVTLRTGMPAADAERRVDEAYAEAKAADAKVREAADRARRAAAVAGFLTAAALAVGLVAACAGAAVGARHREQGTAPALLFGRSRFW